MDVYLEFICLEFAPHIYFYEFTPDSLLIVTRLANSSAKF